MSIGPGVQIGGFAVLGLIGEGGMGKVYRARDSRLKREVALKVLPDEFSGDPERVARFQREAEILATLTHTNIAAIYGLEEASDVRALVMELAEGPTLADRIAHGALSVAEVLPIARQIVDALDYAHEHGVLHRDLKPANIKVTSEGQVKVLDFGLAKALDQGSGASDQGSGEPSNSPTITSPAFTQAGIILGTAAYMAPEQVRGKPLDKRADIWAFGCVLYEMLTGVRAFPGDTISDTLAAVLKSDPDWTKLPASQSAPVRRLLEHCLARDPRERLRDIADVRLLLAAAPDAGTGGPQATSRRRFLVAGSAVAVAVVAWLAGAWSASNRQPLPVGGSVRRVTVQLPVPLSTSSTGGGSSLDIAPDGSAIVFTGRGVNGTNQLHVHRFSDGSTRAVSGPLSDTTAASFPVISNDGRQVAFSSGGRLWRSDIDGGRAELLCSAEGRGNLRGNAWGEDGRVLVASNTGLLKTALPGGACETTLPLESERESRFLWPQVLPDGRGTLFTVSGVSDDADSASVVVVPEGSSERRVVVRGARAGRLTSSGHLLFARGHQILAAPFDLGTLATTADPVVVLSGVASGQFAVPLLDVSDRGDLVYASGSDSTTRLVWVARDGTRTDAGAPRRSYLPEPNLSPDGRHVIVSIGTGDHFLWRWTVDTGTLTPVVSGRDTHAPVWSPDGRRIAFPIYQEGAVAIKDVESAAAPQIVWQTGLSATAPLAWSPDGATILFSRPTADGRQEIAALGLADKTARPLVATRDLNAAFSPDGRWLAYVATESGRREVYVTDFPGAGMKRPVSTDGGFAPAWSRDGQELFYVSAASMMAARVVRRGDSIEFGRPVRLFGGIDFATANSPYSVAPDGRFLFVEDPDASAAQRSQLTLVLNWFEELRRLVPVP